MTVALKRNVPGYVDELGRFRPIRSASYIGGKSAPRKAKASDRRKYSKAKAGDLGKARQSRALEDPWDRDARLEREAKAAQQRERDRIERDLEREIYGETSGRTSRGKGRSLAQFVRAEGGIRRTFRHDGQKARGKRSSWDSGEIDRLSRKQSGSSGLTTSDPRRGKTMDGMFQAAREAGYDVADINDLMARVEAEISTGKKTYSTHGSMTYNPRKKNTAKAMRLPSERKRLSTIRKEMITLLTKRLVDGDTLPHGIVNARDPKKAIERHINAMSERHVRDWYSRNFDFKKNPDLLGMFANAAVGIASTLQINEMVKRKSRRTALKKRGTTKAKATKRTNPTTLRKPARSKGVSSTRTSRTNPSQPNLFKRGKGDLYVLTIGSGDDLISVYLHDGDKDGFSKRFKTMAAAKAYATRNKIKLVQNPAAAKINGMISRAWARSRAKAEYGRELRLAAAAERSRKRRSKFESAARNPVRKPARSKGVVTRSTKANPAGYVLNARKGANTFSPGYQAIHETITTYAAAMRRQKALRKQGFTVSVRHAELKNPPKPKAAAKKRTNPKSTARRRTFEMFQGRKVSTARPMIVSNHAPANLDQLGDLIELKIAGGPTLKFNGKTAKLCAANGKLWIAGKRFAKANPAAAANEINPIGEIDHVVYGTRKPHHGDHDYTHYIHKLGEESGRRPILCVDREGFPVIRGGNYKIEARGIVD